MTSEIQQELLENAKEIQKLIENQVFTVGDAMRYQARYLNIIRKMEDLESSRDNWRQKYKELKSTCNKPSVEVKEV